MNISKDIQIPIKIHPGELVQILGFTNNKYQFIIGRRKVPLMVTIDPNYKIKSTKKWPVSLIDTTYSLLNRWLADAPVISVDDVIEIFNLREYMGCKIENADETLCFRLQALRAILDNVEIITFISPWRTSQFTEFIHGLQTFVADHFDSGSYDPAFVVYDADNLIGFSCIVDRVLEPQRGRLRELVVDF